jgi:hypothetical protein
LTALAGRTPRSGKARETARQLAAVFETRPSMASKSKVPSADPIRMPQFREESFVMKEAPLMIINKTAEKEETLIGFVHEIEDKGWVKGIGISTGDEDFVVETNEWTEKLGKEIENDVRVTGYVNRDPKGQNRILVTGYEVLYDENDRRSDYNLDDDE